MVDIQHRVGATAAPAKVYEALTTRDGLAAWWTTDTKGDGAVGNTLEFRFGEAGGFDMKVVDQRPDKRVEWVVTEGPEEWIGTHVRFDLKQEGDYTIVLFAHEGWAAPGEFMSHCSTRWATYLLSMKQLVETGTGAPHPQELSISNWT
jgi:uncharacterized protein YndB with AHSA1/START domain